MKGRILVGLSMFLTAMTLWVPAWALDEAVLTPTPEREGTMTEKESGKADKEFNAAMSVWSTHRYSNGEKMLR